MSKAVIIKGGGRNKFTGGSIDIDGKDSVAFEMENTVDNEIKDIKITIKDSIEQFESMRAAILSIQDSSVNSETGNSYKSEVLNRISVLINEKQAPATSIIGLMGLLSNWITIQGALTPILAPYIVSLTALLGAT
ncbi:MAG: hypothetical protein BAX61_02885 [Psychrobacter sp. B29-1]|uniref:hypothetical protein n=1 Tax=Psychrobacter sp. B29-1 TaxID=1867800 RepID=UPI00086B1FBA|nr:hypothetical protein [Psychrobacter sp. B29-1]OEH69145.1 MAG: hypothetical protein BAX61_02885 [Psychrobacter sp. B29-1]